MEKINDKRFMEIYGLVNDFLKKYFDDDVAPIFELVKNIESLKDVEDINEPKLKNLGNYSMVYLNLKHNVKKNIVTKWEGGVEWYTVEGACAWGRTGREIPLC